MRAIGKWQLAGISKLLSVTLIRGNTALISVISVIRVISGKILKFRLIANCSLPRPKTLKNTPANTLVITSTSKRSFCASRIGAVVFHDFNGDTENGKAEKVVSNLPPCLSEGVKKTCPIGRFSVVGFAGFPIALSPDHPIFASV